MKKIFVLLAFLLIGLTYQSKATHFAACDLTYTCLGGNDYVITVTFFRDCSGVWPSTEATIQFKSSCATMSVNFPLIAAESSIPITTTCSTAPTTCQQSTSSLYGLMKFVYRKQITLPPCSDWTISYTSGARNPSNNLSNPTGQNWYIFATLNNLAAPCNSSPQFTNYPSAVVCQGQNFCYNHGALDPDGDSLVYYLITPYKGVSSAGVPTPVDYMPTYNGAYPLPSTPPLSVDTITGDVCMNCPISFIAALAIKVEEWRRINGVPVLIGTIMRDLQLNVVNICNNFIPTLAGINPNATQYSPNDTTYFLDVCLGDTIDFYVYSYDSSNFITPPPPFLQNLTMTWNAGIPAGSWNVTGNGTPSPVGHFYWVPNLSVVSNTAQCFTVNVKDDACPYIGQQTFSYCVTVKGSEVFLDPPADSLICYGESYQIVALADTSAKRYHWKVDGNPVTPTINDSTFVINSTLLGVGAHIITVEVDDGTSVVCPGRDQVTVLVVHQPDVPLPADTLACEGQTVVLDAGPGQLYSWLPLGQNTRTINVTSEGPYFVTVDGGYYTRCQDTASVYVNFLDKPEVTLGNDTCVTVPLTLNAHYYGYEFSWNGGPVSNDSIYNANQLGSNNVSVIVAEEFGHGCNDTASVVVKYKPIPKLTISADKTKICSHETVNLTVNDDDGYLNNSSIGYTYLWDHAGEYTRSISVSCLPVGSSDIKVTVNGCVPETATQTITTESCGLTLPNVITPNGDGKNDIFKIDGLEGFPNSTLQIYNRWGKKIFESTNYNYDNAWTGDDAAAGVYYYVLTVNYGPDNKCIEEKDYQGTITILK